MPEVGQQALGLVARVVGPIGVDEVALERVVQMARQKLVLRVVARVELRDAHARALRRIADRRRCGRELGVAGVAEPERVGVARKAVVLRLRRLARAAHREALAPLVTDDPLLLQVRFRELRRWRPCNSQPFCQERMAEIPSIGLVGGSSVGECEDVPLARP